MLPHGEEASPARPYRTAAISGTYEPTNTYALLLPHRSLFSSAILEHLFAFYTKFGPISHWAPVQGLGRVIIVWSSNDCGYSARTGGGGSLTIRGDGLNESTESARQKTSITLRLFPLPATPRSTLDRLQSRANAHDAENPDPNCLAPPEQPRNFLISPPGSPPEGWEPILEDAPNNQTLASDLINALSSIELNLDGKIPFIKRWIGVDPTIRSSDGAEVDNQEVILQTEGGMTVSVFAPAEDDTVSGPWVEHNQQLEYIKDMPMGGNDQEGVSAGWRTPGVGDKTFSKRPMPTARPPITVDEN